MAGDITRTITIRGRQDGLRETADATAKIDEALQGVGSSARNTQDAVEKYNRTLDTAARSNQQFASSQSQLVGGAQSSNRSLGDLASATVRLTSELKFAAGAAYLMSPAFRSFTNTAIFAGVGQLGGALGLVGTAARGALGVLSPALTFLTRMTIPIGIVAATWELLNATIKHGSELLDKYANAQRQFFSSDVDENLKKLTKYQQDDISLTQIKYATEARRAPADREGHFERVCKGSARSDRSSPEAAKRLGCYR